MDHWLEYSITALSQQQGVTPTSALEHVEAILGPRVYFVGYEMTLADLAVYSAIRGMSTISLFISYEYLPLTNCLGVNDKSSYPNINRWFQYLSSKPEVSAVCSKIAAEEVTELS